MAASRVVDARFCRRYRPFFIFAAIILAIQTFLAISFYSLYPSASDAEVIWFAGSTGRSKGNVQLTHHHAKQRISGNDPPGGRFLDDYVADDEDVVGNPWDKSSRDSSSRNVPPKEIERHRILGNPSVPGSKNLASLKNHVNQVPVGGKSHNVSGGSKKGEGEGVRLNKDELDFEPWCEITIKEAISAIHRAVTQQCKHEIANITCLMQENKLYPTQLPRYCPVPGGIAGEYLGCYRDDLKSRLLPKQATKSQMFNSPAWCMNRCLQSGFQFAGVEYGAECFCGMEAPSKSAKIDENSCNMACPTNASARCGGYLAINVYRTGYPKLPKRDPLLFMDSSKEPPVRVVFLLTVNGRAVRQVLRLIKALYSRRHYFYIHVDSRQDYLYRELLKLEANFSNIRLSRFRMSTIWGGASLLQMLLHCISDLLQHSDWTWDFVINLSESDFPIKSLSLLEKFLRANRGKNFVKSHGHDTQRFIAKQGLDKTFYECDTHMWRLGDRTLPTGIRVDGGSDWVALSHSFCEYVIGRDNELLTGLKTVFRYTLLPAESFFHTVLQNSEFCETIIDNNLHVTNWKRKQGCKCQYKHIVDWCGCSPNDFRIDDWPRLQATEDRPFFFARKFEPIVNQQVIEEMEVWINGPKDIDHPSISRYWQNDYHHLDTSPPADDAKVSAFGSFSRLAVEQLRRSSLKPCKIKAGRILEATIFNENDVYKGTLVLFEAFFENEVVSPAMLEVQVRPRQFYTVHRIVGPTGRLKFLQVGSDFDLKEQLFRNFGCILGPFSEPGALHKWGAGEALAATFVWIDPTNTVAGSYEVKIDAGNQVLYHKPTFRQPLRPGIWRLKLLYNWVLVAETLFLVVPLSVYSGHPTTAEQVKFLHSGPGQPYVDHDFTNVEALLGYTNHSDALRKASSNSRRHGRDLLEWIDHLVAQFWTVQDVCFVSQPRHPTGGAPSSSKCSPQLQQQMEACHLTLWSSQSPDIKSDLSDLRRKASTGNHIR